MLFKDFLTGLKQIVETGRDDEGLPPELHEFSPNIKPFISVFRKYTKSDEKAVTTAITNCYKACIGAPFLKAAGIDPGFFDAINPATSAKGRIWSGPVLRHTNTESVSVWVALEKADNPKLSVFENNGGNTGAKLMEGTAATIPFGNKLHIALITAKAVAGKKVDFGQTCLYNVEFANHTNLNQFSDKRYAYADQGLTLPSFVIPSLDLNQLHIAHGSCRNISSEALDNLVGIDTLISKDLNKRPQQLYLSGDQIYADEANDFLEHLYINIGNTMMQGLDSAEKMKSTEEGTADINPSTIIPGERGLSDSNKEFKIADKEYNFQGLFTAFGGSKLESRDFIHDICGFTPTSRYHLFSISDFYGFYLMSWSDECWPEYMKGAEMQTWAKELVVRKKQRDNGELPKDTKSALNDLTGSMSALSKIIGKYEYELKKVRTVNQNPDFDNILKLCFELKKMRIIMGTLKDLADAVHFVSGLFNVRRSLANIASYMIFDDHEITDDWNMTREWVHRAYSKPMGRRVMQNGLAAFAVFQAWGNTPEKFADVSSSGGKLLKAISDWISSNYQSAEQEKIIANLLKIPTAEQAVKYRKIVPGESFPEVYDKPMEWHFTVRHPKFEAIVLDARTFRSFPGSLYGPADHISTKSLETQTSPPVKLAAPFDKDPPELSIVISPCNILTIPLFRNYLSTAALPLAHYIKDYDGSRWQMAAYDPDQADSWEVATKMYESLLARLATRLFKNFPDKKRDTRVVILSGDVHFSCASRIAYYASKPLNSTEAKDYSMVAAHLTSSGFRNEPGAWKKLMLDILGYEFSDFGNTKLRLPEPEIMAGYAKKPAAFNKAKTDEIVLRTRWFPNFKPTMLLQEPLLLPAHKIHPDVIMPKPEWTYRLDFMRAINITKIPNISNTSTHFGLVTDQKPNSEILRRSSFAAITFDWDGEGKLVADISASASNCQVDTTGGKKFPSAPFYIVIEKEIMYVTESKDATAGKFTFKITRGKSDSEKATHKKNSAVKIRAAVSQTNWVAAEPTGKETTEIKVDHLPLSQFKVALASDDLQFPKPVIKTA